MTVTFKPRIFGTKMLYAKQPTAFTQANNSANRTKDAVANDHIAQQYSNTHMIRHPDGSATWHCITDGKELHESYPHPSSTGRKHLPDGSLDETICGNSRINRKGGHTEGSQGPHDHKIEGGHWRGNVGHEGSHSPSGWFLTINGDQFTFRSGHHIGGATGRNDSGYHLGKWTQNAEEGIGLGVNKGSDRKIYQRMYADGTFYLQVKPPGDSGGTATIHIDPAGNIIVTGQTLLCDIKQTITMKAGQQIHLQAPQMKVDVPKTQWNGNIKEDGIHKDRRGTHC